VSSITFLVDENQWLDAIVKETSGKRRSLQTGDFIETQLHVDIPKTLAWGPAESNAQRKKTTLRIDDGLYYFSGELLDAKSRHVDADKEIRGKVVWEGVVDCGFPILTLGIFPEGENPYDPSAKFFEGVGLLWGSISFHTGQLSKTIIGKITDIRELTPAPLSSGIFTIRLLTLDTSQTGPVALKLLLPPRQEAGRSVSQRTGS
jgi:hypothetical protein